jgi:hypothetical protein
MTGHDPRRDAQLHRMLSDAGLSAPPSKERVRRLGERILAAAAPALRERELSQCTIWDYAERWSGMLLPVGSLMAVAAGLCLFVLSAEREPRPVRLSSTGVTLLGAATNRVSSQNLVDLIVLGDRRAAASDGAAP